MKNHLKNQIAIYGLGILLSMAIMVIFLKIILPPIFETATEGPIFIIEGEVAYQIHHLFIGLVITVLGVMALRSRNLCGKIIAFIALGIGIGLVWEDSVYHFIEGMPFQVAQPITPHIETYGILLSWNVFLAMIVALIGVLLIIAVAAIGYDFGTKTPQKEEFGSQRSIISAPIQRRIRHSAFFFLGVVALVLLLVYWGRQSEFNSIILWGITLPQFLFLVGITILIGIAIGNLIIPDCNMRTDAARKLPALKPVIELLPSGFTSHFWVGGLLTLAILFGLVQEVYFPDWGIEEAWDFWTFGHIMFGFFVAWGMIRLITKKAMPPWLVIPIGLGVLAGWELKEYLAWRYLGWNIFMEGLSNHIADIIAGLLGLTIYLLIAIGKGSRKDSPKSVQAFLPDLGHLLGAACLLGLILCGIIFLGEKLSVVPVLWLYTLVPGLTLAENIFALMIAVIVAMFLGLWLITRIMALLVQPPRPNYTTKRFFAIFIPEDSKRKKVVLLALIIAYLMSGFVYIFGLHRSPGDFVSLSFLSFGIGIVTLIYDCDQLRAMIWCIVPLIFAFYFYNLLIVFNAAALLSHLPHLFLAVYYALRYRRTTWYHIAMAGLLWGTHFVVVAWLYPGFFVRGFPYTNPTEVLSSLFISALSATFGIYLATKGATKALALAKADLPAPDIVLAATQQNWDTFMTALTPTLAVNAIRTTSSSCIIPAAAEDGRILYSPRSTTTRLILQLLVFTIIISGLVWVGATWAGGLVR
jgi:hypothetical protein